MYKPVFKLQGTLEFYSYQSKNIMNYKKSEKSTQTTACNSGLESGFPLDGKCHKCTAFAKIVFKAISLS